MTLSRAASGPVAVDYITADGTAVAGEDYTRTSGTLSFAAGETEKTVSVSLLDDALDEGGETFTLRLRNAQGAVIGDGEATGTIVNSDPLQAMWLSRFGRAVADHVTGAVGDRLSARLPGSRVTVGGQGVELSRTKDEAWVGETLTSLAGVLGAPDALEGDAVWPGTDTDVWDAEASVRTISGRALLTGSAFHLATGNEDDASGLALAAWGRVTVGGFDGEAAGDSGSVRVDGDVTTGILGADATWGTPARGCRGKFERGRRQLRPAGRRLRHNREHDDHG